VNPNEAVRKLRAFARDNPGEPWGELFLALDAAMCNGDRLPDDWQKHRFEERSGQEKTARVGDMGSQ
jgi:hypothetical protein